MSQLELEVGLGLEFDYLRVFEGTGLSDADRLGLGRGGGIDREEDKDPLSEELATVMELLLMALLWLELLLWLLLLLVWWWWMLLLLLVWEGVAMR